MLSVNSARAGGCDLFGLAIAELTIAIIFTESVNVKGVYSLNR